MVCMTLFQLACALINETVKSIGDEAATMSAPALINAFMLENDSLNRLLCGGEAGEVPSVSTLEDEFPFDVNLAAPCVYYLGAGLVRDENSTVSGNMLGRADELIGRVSAGIAAESAPVTDIYAGID